MEADRIAFSRKKRSGRTSRGEFSFEKISAIAFYQNAGGTFKIWIDGLEFVRGTPKPPPKPKVIAAPTISLAPEKFGREIGKLEGWTLLGNCTTAEAKETEAKRCLAIEGCGYAESPKIEVIPEATYRVSGLARTEDDWQNNSCIKVKWYDKDKKPVWWEFVRRDSLTKEWKRYEKLVCAPADAAYGSIVCHAQAAWGKSSFFTDVGLAGALPSSLLWDMHFDNLDNDWVNDRSPYGNDGKAYCLSLDDLMVTQDGGAIDFNNRKAKVRFFQSKSLSPAAHDEWVLVAQFFLEEPVAPMDDVPQNASFNILGARWNTSLAVNKEGEKRTLTASFYSYLPDGSVPCYPAVSIPVEPWKWYRLTLVVNNRAHKLDARLLKSGTEILKASARITAGKLADPPFLYVGCLDYPRGGNEPYPWGFWGRMDYMRIYDSIAAYEADEKSLTFGGFGKF